MFGGGLGPKCVLSVSLIHGGKRVRRVWKVKIVVTISFGTLAELYFLTY